MENNHNQDFEAFEPIDLKRFFDALRRGALLILLGLFFGMGAAFLASKLQTPIYSASTQVMVARSNSQGPVTDITQQLSSQQVAQTYVELLSQDWVLENVWTLVGGPKIGQKQIKVSAATNTQIIRITVEDADPARAIVIANSLVKVLAEQNESIQSTRYTDTEASLDLQIAELEGKITGLQTELGKATADALTEQLDNTKTNIDLTQANISTIDAELEKLSNVGTIVRAQSMLTTNAANLSQAQLLLAQQEADYQTLEDKLANDPLVKQDPALATTVQSQMAELGVSINNTRQKIETLSKEVSWLTPLVEPSGLEKALADQQQKLSSQQDLLVSYQDIYTRLLVTGKIDGTTDRITSLEKNLNLYQQIYLTTLDNREAVRLARMQNVTNIVQLNPANATAAPIRPRVLFNTVLGGLAGLILSITTILLMNSLDTTLKTRDDVERILHLPVLGYSLHVVVDEEENPSPHVVRLPRSPAAEAFRSLRTNLDYIAVDKPIKSVLISSPGASEGKTTVAINLAAIIAQSGKRVILVDADLRRPRTHRELGLTNRIGLSDVFLEKISLKDAIQPWDNLGLSVITSGGLPPNPAELLASEKMRQILDELESMFDFVVVDSTPTIVTDSQLIAARAGGVLLILSPGTTQADAARTTVEQYRHVGARLLGVVMNNVQAGQSYYGGYAAPYSYYTYSQGGSKSSSSRRLGTNGKIKLPWHRTPAQKKNDAE
ncbi:MAG: polysaccharide biosynthesis tyrosine autokinase [Chloroflexi bacterium]|nr:polysaccharide biosynthesis tyrosine autokinase [Chloroflexota bacterium]